MWGRGKCLHLMWRLSHTSFPGHLLQELRCWCSSGLKLEVGRLPHGHGQYLLPVSRDTAGGAAASDLCALLAGLGTPLHRS